MSNVRWYAPRAARTLSFFGIAVGVGAGFTRSHGPVTACLANAPASSSPAVVAPAAAQTQPMPTPTPARRPGGGAPYPVLAYTLRIDPAHLNTVDVAIELRGVPSTFRLAMAVHPEYDDRYWRYLDDLHAETSDGARTGAIIREDTTLWRVTLPGGSGVIRYRIHIPSPAAARRSSHQPFVSATGALVGGPDFFLYLPDFATRPVIVHLDLPRRWRIATALGSQGATNTFAAGSAAELLDAPILAGELREWSFRELGVPYHVVYWPLPDATPFDTVAFVDGIRRLVHSTARLFGRTPFDDYTFLFQDGALGALEHRGSVTIGAPSAELARDPKSVLPETAHEFFHAWNLVAIHPVGYGDLRYHRPPRTPGLWWGEGVTMHYADLIVRRAGLARAGETRVDHLASVVEGYYETPANVHVSPERASLAFGDTPLTNPDAAANYYGQGQLLAFALDATLRDSTHDARGLDDLMRAMFERAKGDSGFTDRELERAADSVCGCELDAFFAEHVRGAAPLDLDPYLARLGLRMVVDTVPAVDSAGRARPDLRVWAYQLPGGGRLHLYTADPASVWNAAGPGAGTELVAINGIRISSIADFVRARSTIHLGDRVRVDVVRNGAADHVDITVGGFRRPRVRFLDVVGVTPIQRARRTAWEAAQ